MSDIAKKSMLKPQMGNKKEVTKHKYTK